MKKKILLIIFIIFIGIISVFGKFKWLVVDMGWCSKYDTGFKLGNIIIFKNPSKISNCM